MAAPGLTWRPAHVAAARALALRERAEQDRGDAAAPAEFGQHPVGVIGQRAVDCGYPPPRRFRCARIPAERRLPANPDQRLSGGRLLAPVSSACRYRAPRPMPPSPLYSASVSCGGGRRPASRLLPQQHQDVLHQRKLVGVAAHVVEHPGDQRRLDPAVIDRRRPLDRLAALLARQPRGQELAVVDGLGEIGEPRAVAEKVRSHRDDDIDAPLALLGACQQQCDEGIDVVAALSLPVAENSSN